MKKTVIILSVFALLAVGYVQAQERVILSENYFLTFRPFEPSEITYYDYEDEMFFDPQPAKLTEGCYSKTSVREEFHFCINENGQIDGEVKMITHNFVGRKFIKTILFNNGLFVKSEYADFEGKKVEDEFVTKKQLTTIKYNYPYDNNITGKIITKKSGKQRHKKIKSR